MNNPVFWALWAGLGTWFVTAAGAGTVIFLPHRQQRFLDALLGFSAGVMIAASFWSLLQPAALQAASGTIPPWLVLTLGFCIGAGSMRLADRLAIHIYPGIEKQKTLLLLSITLHNIPEGLAIGVAFGALKPGDPEGLAAAISIAVGIGLQNFPEGAAVALPLRRNGTSRWKSFLAGQASALVEPVASAAGAILVTQVKMLLPWALSFAAGAMILVAVHELIPECQQDREEQSYHSTGGIIAGFAIMTMLDVMLG